MIVFKKPLREVRRVFLHCSASDDPSLYGYGLEKEIDRWHKARGFVGIGYHFVIDKIGMTVEGRSLELNPAAQQGHNKHTIAICVHGLALDKFTDAAMASALDLCDQINRAYEGKSGIRLQAIAAARSGGPHAPQLSSKGTHMNEIIAGAGTFIRHGLNAAGASLVTQGLITGDELNTAAGAVVTLLGVAASLVRNRFFKKKLG
jgi:hypothetical protein